MLSPTSAKLDVTFVTPFGEAPRVLGECRLPVMDDQEHDADERDTDEHRDEIPNGHGVLLAGGRTSLV